MIEEKWMIGSSIFDRFCRKITVLPDISSPDRRNGWRKMISKQPNGSKLTLFVICENLFDDYYTAISSMKDREYAEIDKTEKYLNQLKSLPSMCEEGDV